MEINIQGLRFGKKPPVRDYRTFLLQNYVEMIFLNLLIALMHLIEYIEILINQTQLTYSP